MGNSDSSILIVDDEKSNVALFAAQLKGLSCLTIAAFSGAQALRIVEEQPPDLILLDVMMPGMSGFEVASKLKGDSRTRNIPIIIITALDDRASCIKALECGAEEFLTKPVMQAELLMRVRNLLKLKKYQDLLAAQSRDLEGQLDLGNLRLSEAQEKLVQSDKLASIGQLAAGVAHEINNPICFVKSNLGSLKDYVDDFQETLKRYEAVEALLPADAEAVRNVREFKASVDLDFIRKDMQQLIAQTQEGIARVEKIVLDLKGFARSERNPVWGLANLHACLDSAINIANNEIKYRADIVREYGVIPEIECISTQLGQVFLNLLVNAAQSISEGSGRGSISVRSGCLDERHVWVEISDTGCGMTDEQIRLVFDPFYTTKPVGVGTGLGLSISYGIVESHSGRIEVSSTLGHGATFRVVLPVRKSAVTTASGE